MSVRYQASGSVPENEKKHLYNCYTDVLYSGKVEVGNEAFRRGSAALDKAVPDSEASGKIHDFIIFIGRQLSGKLRECGKASAWRILVHDADIDAVAVSAVEATEDFDGVIRMAGKDEMPDNHAAGHHAVFVEDRIADLTEHFIDSRFRRFGIVRGMGKTLGKLGVMIFEIRKVDVDVSFQHAQRFYGFVSAGIVYGGNAKSPGAGHRERFHNMRNELRTRDKIDVRGALTFQLEEDFAQATDIDCLAAVPVRDAAVLAVYAFQSAAGEEHRAGACGAGKTRLFPKVQSGAGGAQLIRFTAEADGASAVYAASSWTERAVGVDTVRHFSFCWCIQ